MADSPRIVPAWSEPDGTPYQPSNGTEGMYFFDGLCAHCQHDKSMNGSKHEDDCAPEDLCDLIARSMAFDEEDPEYPVEWQWQGGVPTCTRFRHVDQEPPRERCAHTADLFQADQGGLPPESGQV